VKTQNPFTGQNGAMLRSFFWPEWSYAQFIFVARMELCSDHFSGQNGAMLRLFFWPEWSYTQIIFLIGFAGQGSLNKGHRLVMSFSEVIIRQTLNLQNFQIKFNLVKCLSWEY
jgi:hypothetical protein